MNDCSLKWRWTDCLNWLLLTLSQFLRHKIFKIWQLKKNIYLDHDFRSQQFGLGSPRCASGLSLVYSFAYSQSLVQLEVHSSKMTLVLAWILIQLDGFFIQLMDTLIKKKNKLQVTNTLQTSDYLMFANVPLAKASLMAKSQEEKSHVSIFTNHQRFPCFHDVLGYVRLSDYKF